MGGQSPPIKVLFEEYDPETEYLLAFRELDILRIGEIESLIAERVLDHDNELLDLGEQRLRKFEDLFEVKPRFQNVLYRLHVLTLPSDLPYLSHNDRELALMRDGRKPLSVFSGHEISDAEKSIYSRLFDPLVSQGLFSREEYQISKNGRLLPGSRFDRNFILMYSVRGQEWRMETYRLLRDAVAHVGHWNDEYERLFGTLLGYSDNENDAWLQRRAAWGIRWGCATLYLLVSEDEVAFIQSKCLRALPEISDRSIDFFISQKGMEPVIERLGKYIKGSDRLARINISYRDMESFQDLADRHIADQFGPFIIGSNKMAAINSMISGPVTILTLCER
jgi:hypothetical protein